MEIPYQHISPEEEKRELQHDIAELLCRRRQTSIFNFAARQRLSQQIAASKARLNELQARGKEKDT